MVNTLVHQGFPAGYAECRACLMRVSKRDYATFFP